jgi:hypothetical protein
MIAIPIVLAYVVIGFLVARGVWEYQGGPRLADSMQRDDVVVWFAGIGFVCWQVGRVLWYAADLLVSSVAEWFRG